MSMDDQERRDALDDERVVREERQDLRTRHEPVERGPFAGMRRLAAGVYALGDELHVDLDAVIIATGGNPARSKDVTAALRQVQKIAERHGIPVEVRSA